MEIILQNCCFLEQFSHHTETNASNEPIFPPEESAKKSHSDIVHQRFPVVKYSTDIYLYPHLCILDLSLFLFSAFFIKCMFTCISFGLWTKSKISYLPCPASSEYLLHLLQPEMMNSYNKSLHKCGAPGEMHLQIWSYLRHSWSFSQWACESDGAEGGGGEQPDAGGGGGQQLHPACRLHQGREPGQEEHSFNLWKSKTIQVTGGLA